MRCVAGKQLKPIKRRFYTMKTTEIGQIGENIAAEYLAAKGYRIVERNYRLGRGEIDIIAWLGEDVLVFVEVKTRASDGYGGPEDAVTAKKQDLLARTAGCYMESIDYEWAIRFDIVSVIWRNGQLFEIRHVEDAFFPGY